MALFKTIGEAVTVPTVVGYKNLPSSTLSDFVEDLEWREDDFADPKGQPFWEFSGLLFCEELDCTPVRSASILAGTDWQYTFELARSCYAVRFTRCLKGLPIAVTIQQVQAADLVLPECLTDEQAEEITEKLSGHVYGRDFDPEPDLVSTVIRDLRPYADLQDHEIDALKSEPTVDLLNQLFDECRKAKDLRAVLDNFFNLQLGRTV